MQLIITIRSTCWQAKIDQIKSHWPTQFEDCCFRAQSNHHQQISLCIFAYNLQVSFPTIEFFLHSLLHFFPTYGYFLYASSLDNKLLNFILQINTSKLNTFCITLIIMKGKIPSLHSYQTQVGQVQPSYTQLF